MLFNSIKQCLILSPILFSSCVENQWVPPEKLHEPFVRPAEELILTINDLLGLYQQQIALEDNPILDLNAHSSKFLTGVVISSDASGNYYKELVIQDRAENPSAGLRVLVDHPSLSDRFAPGHQIYIALQGLDLGPDQEMLTLGIEDGGRIKAFDLDQDYGSRVIRDTLIQPIVPKILPLAALDRSVMNQWIMIEDVQFHRALVSGQNIETFAAGENDRYDGNRLIESCLGSDQLILQTSVFANFQTQKLPQGRGFLQGILQYDYYGEYPVLVINRAEDVVMESPQRCDPEVLQCTDPEGSSRLFQRYDFENVEDLEGLIAAGWRLVSNTSNPLWDFGTYSGNRYLLIDGRESDSDTLRTKLISPVIEIPAQTQELTLELDVQVNFAQGIPLSFYIGQVQQDQINWTLLDYTMPIGPANTYGSFQTVGPISINCIASPLVLGLDYSQLSEYDRTRYHLDNIEWRVWP